MTDSRRSLPSVNSLVESDLIQALVGRSSRSVVTDAVRAVVDRARREPAETPATSREWARAVEEEIARQDRSSLRPVFNATGVVLHTNLGRAPLAAAAVAAVAEIAAGYSNLEYDLDAGSRGSRYDHCVRLLCRLTGADDAIVVNNCAAALVLALNTMADGRDVLVSRGELIEIGGSFRVPDIMAKSGANLVEVGTTNRTHGRDYEGAISGATAALLKVHRSNFVLEGFVADASLSELSSLARSRGLPVIHDFGSGLLIPLDEYGLSGEPTAADSVKSGAALTAMSGDKLLGGPQAGILVGGTAAIAACRANPLTRALRVDKLTLAALEATLMLYRHPEHARVSIPVLAMLTAPVREVHRRATALSDLLSSAGIASAVVGATATVGGGAFPTARIPSAAVALHDSPEATEAKLRAGNPAIVARIADGAVLMDLRTVPAASDARFGRAIVAALR
jgi:L-seryl-tRNA(Ser) seleniumtransferase